jgi:hypothetical protein
VAEVQDTPDRELLALPDGFGVGSIDHLAPFQFSAKIT